MISIKAQGVSSWNIQTDSRIHLEEQMGRKSQFYKRSELDQPRQVSRH